MATGISPRRRIDQLETELTQLKKQLNLLQKHHRLAHPDCLQQEIDSPHEPKAHFKTQNSRTVISHALEGCPNFGTEHALQPEPLFQSTPIQAQEEGSICADHDASEDQPCPNCIRIKSRSLSIYRNSLKEEWKLWSEKLQTVINSRTLNKKNFNTSESLERKNNLGRRSADPLGGSQLRPQREGRNSIEVGSTPHLVEIINSQDRLFLNIQTESHQIMEDNHVQNPFTEEDDYPFPEYCPKSFDNLVESICLYGPCSNQLTKHQNDKPGSVFSAGHQLIYPSNMRPQYSVYGHYLYPKDVGVKLVKEKRLATQVDKIIFKTHSRPTDVLVYVFCQQEGHPITKNDETLKDINPQKWLYSLSVEFTDYGYFQQEEQQASQLLKESAFFSSAKQTAESANFPKSNWITNGVEGQSSANDTQKQISFQESTPNCTMKAQKKSMTFLKTESVQSLDCTIAKEQDSAVGTEKLMQESESQRSEQTTQVYKSNYTLSLFTYFPYIKPITDLLLWMLTEIKIKRMEEYTRTKSKENCGIGYFTRQLKTLSEQILAHLRSVDLKQPISIDLPKLSYKYECIYSNPIEVFSQDWLCRVLRMFDKESLYEFHTHLLMEHSIYIVSDSKWALTHSILMAVLVLSRPFGYPFPSISVVFDQQLLQSPSTALLGIHSQSEDWARIYKQVSKNRVQFAFITLGSHETKVKSNVKRNPASNRLKRIYSNYYKRTDLKSRKPEVMMNNVTKQELEAAKLLLGELQAYYDDQLHVYMPNRAIIDHVKHQCRAIYPQNESKWCNQVTKYVDRFIQQSINNPDPFIEEFIKKQIFYVYSKRKYDIF